MSENQLQRIEDAKSVPALLNHPTIQKKLETALGDRKNQFASSLVSLVGSNNALAKCDPMTVLTSAMQAALLNLPIQQSLAFAYCVPYKGKAQFQLGYRGIIQLAQRSGQFAALNDGVIGAGQLIEYNELTGDLKVDFTKEPEKGKDPDGYFCYFKLKNGFEKTVFWSHEKVKAHAARFSQSYRQSGGVWKTDFEAMARKTVIKSALSKYAPLSVEMQQAVLADQSVLDADGNPITYPDNKPDESAFDVASEPNCEEGETEDVPEEEESIDDAIEKAKEGK